MDKIKDFSRTFNIMRNITILAISLLAITQVAWIYAYYIKDQEVRKLVFIATANGTTTATDSNGQEVNFFEARNFVREFMNNMFGHDGSSFKRNIEHALNMINKKDGLQIYSDFKTAKVLETYVKYDSRSRIQIDSVVLNMKVIPITGNVYAKQYTSYAGQEAVLPIAAKFTIDRRERSDKNTYGLLLSTFSFIEYQPAPVSPENKIAQDIIQSGELSADSIINQK